MKPTTIQMTCFNFFTVINEVKVLSVTHFFQIFLSDGRTEGRKERQTLIHRPLPATAGNPKNELILNNRKIAITFNNYLAEIVPSLNLFK